MALHRTRVGLHARNDLRFTEADYQLVRQARIETLKTMSLTEVSVYQRLRRENPDLEFIVRLFDDRARNRSHPSPAEFVARMAPIVRSLKPYATKFEIHNEPNHVSGLEGWGATDADARSFLSWYMAVLKALKRACPWAEFGFPGLALNDPHRDLDWLRICRDAINASDWLGCHCYWQYGNMMSDQWGLRFRLYHQRFPGKRIEITEFGNSTPNLAADEMSRQYVQYYQELNRAGYLGSASAFIASSPDREWASFVWMKEGGVMNPVVKAVGSMTRKAAQISSERKFDKTGKTVRGSFLDLYDKYGQEICGNPITNEFRESGIATQFFERVAMEERKAGQVSLKAIGSETVASRKRIAELTTLVAELSAEPLPTAESIIDSLSDLVDRLAPQIQALRVGLTAVEGSEDATGEAAALVKPVREQIAAMQKLSDALHVELAAALRAMNDEQSALIDHLKEEIQALREQINEPETEASAPAPQAPSAGVSQPAMRDIISTLPKHKTARYKQRPRSDIKVLIVHHSATAADTAPDTIARYHVNEWNWPGIGYHFVLAADGTIYQTNTLETVSNHAAPVNKSGVGVCFLGNFMKAAPPAAQLQAGAHLIAWLLQELSLDTNAIEGHREVMQTACPGDQWADGAGWKLKLLQEIAEIKSAS